MVVLATASVVAQDPIRLPTERVTEAVPPAGAMPTLLQDIGLDQKLNEPLPLGLRFTDEQGRDVALGDYFGRRPVVLVLASYECPMLCTQVLNGLVSAIGVLNFSVGQEFDIVTVSFDPGETPALARGKKAAYIERYKRAGAEGGWHFLTGSQHSITQLTRAVGFRYAYNAEVDHTRTRAESSSSRPTGGCRAISTASNTARATCGWPSSTPPTARSAASWISCCWHVSTTTRRAASTAWRSCGSCRRRAF